MSRRAEGEALAALVAAAGSALGVPVFEPNSPESRPAAPAANGVLMLTWEQMAAGQASEVITGNRRTRRYRDLVVAVWVIEGGMTHQLNDALDAVVAALSPGQHGPLYLGAAEDEDPMTGELYPGLYGRALRWPYQLIEEPS